MDKNKFLSWCVTKKAYTTKTLKQTRLRYDAIFRLLGNKSLSADTAPDIILTLREKGLQNASINSYIRVIQAINEFEQEHDNYLNLMKHIDYLPIERRIPTLLTENEINTILSVKVPYTDHYRNGDATDLNYHLCIWLILATGCRADEACQLKVGDIILGEDSYVDFTKTKTKSPRTTPIPYYEKLFTHLKDRDPWEYAFTSGTSDRLDQENLRKDWKKRIRLAGVKKNPRLHDARNSYIMEHIKKRTEWLTLSKLVGHADPASTMWYASFDQTTLQAAAKNHFFYKQYLTPKEKLEMYRKKLEEIRNEIEHDPDFELPKLVPGENHILLDIAIKEKPLSSSPTSPTEELIV